jgi:protein TonB
MHNHFTGFLALSVAAHAILLLAWTEPNPQAGNPGRVLLLDVADRTGQLASLAAIDPEKEHSQAPSRQPAPLAEPVHTAQRSISKGPVETTPQTTDTPQADSPDTPETGAAPNLAASSPRPSQEESDRHLRSSVLELVMQRLSYPAIARRKGWQGVVILALHIESDGLISDLHVNETSGYAALDQAAVKSLQLASIPGARQWLHGHSIDMLIPIEYRLLDS